VSFVSIRGNRVLNFKKYFFFLVLVVSCNNLYALDKTNLTVEELRISKAEVSLPLVVNRLSKTLDSFKRSISDADNLAALRTVVSENAPKLWADARISYQKENDFDDRILYWARLQMTKALRDASSFKDLNSVEQGSLLWQLELLTRGQQDINFDSNTKIKILLTGFDPFFLDRNLDQSNPSGAVALALDGLSLVVHGKSIEVESLIVPVRFEDFDKGMIEELLTPYLRDKTIDMLITVSMGRDDFDLERFPGLRRSAKAPDNLNVFTGASSDNPLVPSLNGRKLEGPEFVEFSLPASSMKNMKGDFKINDNHRVTTTEKTFTPIQIDELKTSTSVQGSGGGYLSNEVSYRSLLLRDAYYPNLPVGHIHTPRFVGFEPKKTEKIIQQIKAMILLSITDL